MLKKLFAPLIIALAFVVGGFAPAYAVTESFGSWTGTGTGMTTSPTCAFTYTIVGNMATLVCEAGLTGTSNTTAFTITGVPKPARPKTTARCRNTSVTDNTGKVPAEVCISTTGTLTFGMGAALATTGFTNSGTKAIAAGWSFSYPIN